MRVSGDLKRPPLSTRNPWGGCACRNEDKMLRSHAHRCPRNFGRRKMAWQIVHRSVLYARELTKKKSQKIVLNIFCCILQISPVTTKNVRAICCLSKHKRILRITETRKLPRWQAVFSVVLKEAFLVLRRCACRRFWDSFSILCWTFWIIFFPSPRAQSAHWKAFHSPGWK